MNTQGRFIVLEGGEGSGKSTQIGLLAERLAARGIDLVVTREPGGTALGAELREWLLHRGVDARTESLLLAADRAHHIADVITPALERGAWVVCDRHSPSFLAYQGVARGQGVEHVDLLNDFAIGGCVPDLVIVLDVDEDTARLRVPVPTDTIEASGSAFHSRVRAAYRDLAAPRGWVVVDGSGDLDEVADRVWTHVETLPT